MAELLLISNAELSKAIQLVEQAFQLSPTEPLRAYNLFEKSSIAFLQAIRSKCPRTRCRWTGCGGETARRHRRC
jgi:hypothetical protein